ncbi:MAG: hypothetical protein KAX49_18995 [Halanaerobiales bacterium]|nr:hypothetical protein [Halanaerobiales bacterium]
MRKIKFVIFSVLFLLIGIQQFAECKYDYYNYEILLDIDISLTGNVIQDNIAWCPDSNKIAVISEDGVYIISSDGKIDKIMEIEKCTVSNVVNWVNNQKFLFLVGGDEHIYSYDLIRDELKIFQILNIPIWKFYYDKLNNEIFFIDDYDYNLYKYSFKDQKSCEIINLDYEIYDVFLNKDSTNIFFGRELSHPDYSDWYVYDTINNDMIRLSDHLFQFLSIDKEKDIAYVEETTYLKKNESDKTLEISDMANINNVLYDYNIETKYFVVNLDTLAKKEFDIDKHVVKIDGVKVNYDIGLKHMYDGKSKYILLSPDKQKALLIGEPNSKLIFFLNRS